MEMERKHGGGGEETKGCVHGLRHQRRRSPYCCIPLSFIFFFPSSFPDWLLGKCRKVKEIRDLTFDYYYYLILWD